MTISFRKSDFEQLEYKIVFQNLTSGTVCKENTKIEAYEIREESMVLRVPSNSCNNSHSLMLYFIKGSKTPVPTNLPQNGKGKYIYFSVTGKILNKFVMDDHSVIEFKFNQYEKDRWVKIIEELKARQQKITNTVNLIRPHE